MCDFFLPLGGAGEVGASAYFLSINGLNLLLDCGARINGEERYPDYSRLLNEISDYANLDLILISHAHFDHMGSFAQIAALAPDATIITTEDTKQLITLQLLNFERVSLHSESERLKAERYRQAQLLISRIQTEPVMRTFSIRGTKITFFPVGHMIGAVMISIQTEHHNILYSGDFSMQTAFELNTIHIPELLHPSTLLLNAPNVYQDSSYWKNFLETGKSPAPAPDRYAFLAHKIRCALKRYENVYLTCRSIPKLLELFYLLESSQSRYPIYLDFSTAETLKTFSQMGYSVYQKNIHTGLPDLSSPHILVGQDSQKPGYCTLIFDQYSLHASPFETLQFILKTGADTTYLLHAFHDSRKKSFAEILTTCNPNQQLIPAVNYQKYYFKKETKMKHQSIYQEIMEKELAVAMQELELQNQKGTSNREWIAIYGSLLYPDAHPRDAYENLQKTFIKQEHFSYNDYLNALKSSNLDHFEKRRYALKLTEKGISLLKEALNGNPASISAFANFTEVENLQPRDRKNHKIYFIGKCMVIFLILIDPDLQCETYRPIAFTFGARYCDKLLRMIRRQLLQEYNIAEKRTSARDVLLKTEAALNESSQAANHFSSQSELERLRFINNNYKNSLELVQAMLDELNDTIDETSAEAKKTAIHSFYIKMNSDTYGNLLDSLDFVERKLTQLKQDGIRTPAQFLPLTIIFKQLSRFVKDCGILPIETTGRTFEASAEDLSNYIYTGTPFADTAEKKLVTVTAPGWTYQSTVISLPTVNELE